MVSPALASTPVSTERFAEDEPWRDDLGPAACVAQRISCAVGTRDTALAVSEENVDVVRETFGAFARRDFDRVLDNVDPDVEVHVNQSTLKRRVWHGPRGVMDFLRLFWEPWDDLRVDAKEFIDAGDRVVVLLDQYARPRRGKFELKMSVGHVFEIIDGRITTWSTYADQARALEAAGLRG